MLEQQRKSTLTARLLIYPIRMFLKLLLLTCKYEVKGGENLRTSAKKGSSIIMLWHQHLPLIGPSILSAAPELSYCAFISNSKDGDIAAEYTTSYAIGRTIRVPHDSREAALKTLISRLRLKRDVAIITPDGPRGPRQEVKPGIAIAAKETEASIIPFSWSSTKFWQLKSWDRMQIPKPFSTIQATFGTPISLSKESTIEDDLKVLKAHLSFFG
jgi:lysophospholipid acyltransferase (LPLAT)-like uncharacterized protein